jgi:hypothetical protein
MKVPDTRFMSGLSIAGKGSLFLRVLDCIGLLKKICYSHPVAMREALQAGG